MSGEQSEKQPKKGRADHLKPYQYKKGVSGNPSGRPKGAISMKEYVRRKLEKMDPKEREEYLDGLDKKFVWEMAEGKAAQKQEIKGDINLTSVKGLTDEELEELANNTEGSESGTSEEGTSA